MKKNKVNSLVSLCILALKRNIECLFNRPLETDLGPVPSHLLKPILEKATFAQLEQILLCNPDLAVDENGNVKVHALLGRDEMRRDTVLLA